MPDASVNSIRLMNIRGYGYTGALPEEQVLGQWFQVDLVLGLDLSIAGESDQLTDTLNYCAVISLVQDLLKTSKFALLERLATAIADAILQLPAPAPIQQVQVLLTKLTPPIPEFAGTVTVEVLRRKSPGEN